MEFVQHSVTLIYPFRHHMDREPPTWLQSRFGDDEPSSEWRERMDCMGKRWRPWWSRPISADSLADALDDTYFFFPYVRERLFPEIQGNLPDNQAAAVKRAVSVPFASWAENLGRHAVMRCTLKLDDPSILPWRSFTITLQQRQSQKQSRFAIDSIDCALFPHRVGFLIMAIQWLPPDGTQRLPSLQELNDLLFLLKTVHPPRVDIPQPLWAPTGEPAKTLTSRSLIEFLLAGVATGTAFRQESFEDYRVRTKGQPAESDYTMTPHGQVHGEQLHRVVYACLQAGGWSPSSPPIPPLLFKTPGDWQAYELATLSPLAIPGYVPRKESLQEFLAPRTMRFWENWSALAAHDSVAFVGESPDGITTGHLQRQIESDYLPLYLLALYQYVRLTTLAGEIQSTRRSLREDVKESTRFWDEFLDFRNHFWFAEPTPKPQGTDLYRKFQYAMNLPDLFREIREELAELQEYFEQQSEKNVECWFRFLAIAGVLIAIVSLAIAWFGMDLATIDYFYPNWLQKNSTDPLGNL